MAKKKNKPIQMTLYDVVLSYPDLHNPKEFKGNTYYKTDVLMDTDHSQLGELRTNIKKAKIAAWGSDKSEWPEGHASATIKDGSQREDQKEYQGKKFITATKNADYGQPGVFDLKGKAFAPQSVRGGMFANVAITIGVWKDGDGASIWLDGVQIDTKKKPLNFGGGRALKDRFNSGKDSDDEEDESDEDEDDEDDEDEPRGKKNKKSSRSSRDEDEDDEDEDDESEDDEDE